MARQTRNICHQLARFRWMAERLARLTLVGQQTMGKGANGEYYV